MSNGSWPDYIDDYATCENTDATFRVIGDELDPDKVTSLLGLEPTEAHRKGDQRERDGKPVRGIYPTGIWMLSSEDVVESLDLRRHIDWIVERLRDKTDALSALRERGFITNIHAWWVGAEVSGPTLSPKQLEGMARLGLIFDIDWGGWGNLPEGLHRKLAARLQRDLGTTDKASVSLAQAFASLYQISSRTLWELDYLLNEDMAEPSESPARNDLVVEGLGRLFKDWTDAGPPVIDELRRLGESGDYPSDEEALSRLRSYRERALESG